VFQLVGDQAVLLKRTRCLALTIMPEDREAADVEELRRLFRLVPGRAVYRVKSQENDEVDLDAAAAVATVPPVLEVVDAPLGDRVGDEPITATADPEPLPAPVPIPEDAGAGAPSALVADDLRDVVAVNVRSGYQVLAFLSKGVEVPEAHARQGSVILFKGPDGRPFDARRLTQGLFHVCVQKHRPLRSDLAVYYRGYWYYIPEADVQSRATLNYVKLVLDMRSQAGESPVLTLPVN
jgi:hypothetical protein